MLTNTNVVPSSSTNVLNSTPMSEAELNKLSLIRTASATDETVVETTLGSKVGDAHRNAKIAMLFVAWTVRCRERQAHEDRAVQLAAQWVLSCAGILPC